MAFYLNKILIIIFLLNVFQIHSQDKWIDRDAEISFDATVPSFEPVAAKSKSATAVVEPGSSKIAVLVFVNTFKFKVALMQEHFNEEKWADTDQYPKATFNGEILNFDAENPIGTYTVKGELTVKDVSKNIEVQAEFTEKKEQLIFTSQFEVEPEEFNFDIPKVVINKIAEKISINLNFAFEN